MSRRERMSERWFFGVSALVFTASAGVTIAWSISMSAMGGMSMPGGWTMSMMWMRMPGQTWAGMAASFVGMWVVMMVAMMLPSLLPMLWRYREEVGGSLVGDARAGWLSGLFGVGYFGAWAAVGLVVFAVGVVFATISMREPGLARAVPIGSGALVLAAGAFQFSGWKRRRLADCREVPGSNHVLPAAAGTAWRHGVRLGLHCCHSCAGLMTTALLGGLMDLRVMAVVTAAITAERLAPSGVRVARAIGVVAIAAGMWVLVARV